MVNESQVRSIIEEGKKMWLKTCKISTILNNYDSLTINAEPVNKPISGTIVLFDSKRVTNFGEDGHRWKKRKGNKKLKVDGEDKILVYYENGVENPKFYRRSYRLLDKDRENIILVHYLEFQEGSEITSEAERAHLKILHDLNALEWHELVNQDDLNNFDGEKGKDSCLLQQQNPSEDMLEDYLSDPNSFGLPQQMEFSHTNLRDLQTPDSFAVSLDDKFASNSTNNHLQSAEEAARETPKTGVDTSRDDDSEKDDSTSH